jgi:uncharacterized DUF497 family protein
MWGKSAAGVRLGIPESTLRYHIKKPRSEGNQKSAMLDFISLRSDNRLVVRYNFEWSLEKARANVAKHGVAFEDAATVFRDRRALTIFDEDHSDDEERWVTLGFDRNAVLLIVIHTFNSVDESTCTIRIISAREATRREMRQYEDSKL